MCQFLTLSPTPSNRTVDQIIVANSTPRQLSRCFPCNFMASASGAGGRTGPFDAMAPRSPTSGTYAGLIPKPSYDVKHTLASALYTIITGMQRTAFLDSEELKYGDFLPKEIEAAMSSALLHIAIFSKRYAESPWCLAEISFMLKTGAIIIPIFYDVEPSDLRSVDQGKGAYSEDFKKHQEKGRYSKEQLEEWREALCKASFLDGQIMIKNDDDGRKLLKNVGNTILKILKPLTVAKYPVGINEIVEDFEMNTFQSVQGHQTVHVVGICGTGGSGKTTLAKEIYNRRSPLMESSSFIFYVRDAAAKGMLPNKQLKLLKDLGVEGGSIENLEDWKTMLARDLRSVRVLIVLDDVDHANQLDALMPIKDSLCEGSLVIVTSRKIEVLKSWGVSCVYEMKEMDGYHAEQLFCWHAFSKPTPLDGFEELVKKFVNASKGLPLYLKELGEKLYGTSSHEFWECQLDKISRVMPRNIKDAQS